MDVSVEGLEDLVLMGKVASSVGARGVIGSGVVGLSSMSSA